MFIDLTAEQVALREELRAYFAGLMSADERAAMRTDRHGAAYREVVRRMGRDGWLGVGWPIGYGGRGFGQIEQQIFADEALRADVPLPSVTLQTVGPTLLEHGTPEQKEFFLPRILAGEVHFAIGYTEPEAGTDLAALRTRAVRSGDVYIVNGQKIFTTGAHEADYVWLACRTDPAAPRHKGISILIVPTSDPGFSWTPIITHDGAHHVNATYYSDVRVPVSMRVGEENRGWRLITTQLNHERVMLGPAGRIAALLDRVRDWVSARGLADEPDVARALRRTAVALRVNELLNWQVAAASGEPAAGGPAASGERTAGGPAASGEPAAGGPAASGERTAGGPAASEASFADRPTVEARRVSRPGDTTASTPAGGGSGGLVSTPRINTADASVTKVFSSVQLMSLGPLLADVVGRHGDPADPQTADLLDWLDVQIKRNTVLTFGGGVNEIQRELIATAGLGLPRAPR